jgi:TRAP-type transport system periplasmic protein
MDCAAKSVYPNLALNPDSGTKNSQGGQAMKIAQKIHLAAGVALACVVTAAVTGKANAAEMLTLKAVCAWPINSSSCSQGLREIKAINAAAEGKLKINVLGGPEVVRARDGFQALRSGIVDVVITTSSYYSGEEPVVEAFSMLRGDLSKQQDMEIYQHSHALAIINKVFMEKSQVHLIAETNFESFNLMLAKPAKTLADLKGMSIRVTSPSVALAFKELGMTPVNMTPSELYTALQRGIVQGAWRNPSDAWTQGEQGIYKTILEPPVSGSPVTGLYIAGRVWSKMPSDLKALVTKTAIALEPSMYDYFSQATAEATMRFQKAGVKVVKLPSEDTARIVKALNDYWAVLMKKSPTYAPQLQAALEPYTK